MKYSPDKERIKKLLQEGLTHKIIKERLGCSYEAIKNVKRNMLADKAQDANETGEAL